jgi:hypothetical protein
VGDDYSFTPRNVLLYRGTIQSNIGQGQRAMAPIVARNTLLGGPFL